MSRNEKLAAPADHRLWIRPEAYLVAMARKRTYRRARDAKPRTQPESPRLLLSTLPILAVIVMLGILGVAIMIAAFPGNQPQVRPKPPASREWGIAPRGWFQEAQKEMRR
jgi:hypothetical protein